MPEPLLISSIQLKRLVLTVQQRVQYRIVLDTCIVLLIQLSLPPSCFPFLVETESNRYDVIHL